MGETSDRPTLQSKVVIVTGGASGVGQRIEKGARDEQIDAAEYGGAPLLGVDGRCIICHGSSSAKAIKNGVRVAAEFTYKEVNKHIVEEVESY